LLDICGVIPNILLHVERAFVYNNPFSGFSFWTTLVNWYYKKHLLAIFVGIIRYLPPFTTIHIILLVQSLGPTTFFYNFNPDFLWFTPLCLTPSTYSPCIFTHSSSFFFPCRLNLLHSQLATYYRCNYFICSWSFLPLVLWHCWMESERAASL